MADTIYNVLFLCTGNSCRSILAEAIMNREGMGRFKGFGAGSNHTGQVNPHAIALLKNLDYGIDGFRSKNRDEFTGAGVPEMDFIFTVCDNAAGEVCPVWPGQPVSAHWGVPDPADFVGSEAETAAVFADTYRMLENRISVFVNLPIDSLDKLTLKGRLDGIGAGKHDGD